MPKGDATLGSRNNLLIAQVKRAVDTETVHCFASFSQRCNQFTHCSLAGLMVAVIAQLQIHKKNIFTQLALRRSGFDATHVEPTLGENPQDLQ